MTPFTGNPDRFDITIQHSLDGFSYVLYNLDKQQFTSLQSVSEANISLKDAIAKIEAENECKIKDFNKIMVIFDNNRNTFVPAEIYQNKGKYLDILGINDKDSVTCTDLVNIANANNVYAIAKTDLKTLQEISQNIEYHHASSVLVASLIKDYLERTDDTRVFLNVKNQSFEMTVIKESNLLFDNNFRFKTKEDFLYFLLNSIEQLHLDASSVPVTFLGKIEEKSTLVELTSRYVRDIRFLRRDNEINLAIELTETPFYYNYVLYKSLRCEL